MIAGTVKMSVVAQEDMVLASEHYLGLEADETLKSARKSKGRAERHLFVAQERVKAAEEARRVSQELVDSGKVVIYHSP